MSADSMELAASYLQCHQYGSVVDNPLERYIEIAVSELQSIHKSLKFEIKNAEPCNVVNATNVLYREYNRSLQKMDEMKEVRNCFGIRKRLQILQDFRDSARFQKFRVFQVFSDAQNSRNLQVLKSFKDLRHFQDFKES